MATYDTQIAGQISLVNGAAPANKAVLSTTGAGAFNITSTGSLIDFLTGNTVRVSYNAAATSYTDGSFEVLGGIAANKLSYIYQIYSNAITIDTAVSPQLKLTNNVSDWSTLNTDASGYLNIYANGGEIRTDVADVFRVQNALAASSTSVGSAVYAGGIAVGKLSYIQQLITSSTISASNFLINDASTVTREIQLLSTVRNTGATSADIAVLGSFTFYRFVTAAINSIWCTLDVPHDYKLGSDLVLHIHWVTDNSVAGNLMWQVRYNMAADGAAFNMTGTDLTYNIEPNNTSTLYAHRFSTVGTIPGASIVADGHNINLRLTRVGTDPFDTYNSSAYVMSFSCHYAANRFGST